MGEQFQPCVPAKSMRIHFDDFLNSPPASFRAVIWFLPVSWLSVWSLLLLRLPAVLHIDNFFSTTLKGCIFVTVPVVAFVTLVAKSMWFRKRVLIILFVWGIHPFILFSLGLTPGIFLKGIGGVESTENLR